MKSIIEELLPLDRPEYAKQTEALLTDLLWRSPGSRLGSLGLFELLPKASERLVYQILHGNAGRLVETGDLLSDLDVSELINTAGHSTSGRDIADSVLTAVRAPRARGLRSEAVVPVYTDLVALQTLHGMVNKANPANLAKITETVGCLGGSPGFGAVAMAYASAVHRRAQDAEGLSYLGTALANRVASHVWDRLCPSQSASGSEWPAPEAGETDASFSPSGPAPLAQLTATPFSWFWSHWYTLCGPDSQWCDRLPERRFVDWSLCLLRTGLSFAYVWEARFYTRLRSVLEARANGNDHSPDLRALNRFLEDGETLVRYQPRSVPATQKEVWKPLSRLLAEGYMARAVVRDELADHTFSPADGESLQEAVGRWILAVPKSTLDAFKEREEPDARTATNQKEFVRYLLQPRSADDDALDQADLYYLLKRNTQSTWLEPGPEWLVVVASLLADHPEGEVTLGELLSDLSRLGISISKIDLVALLEAAGLTTDSPDADEALVVEAAF